MNLQKNKPWRSPAYLKYIRNLPCVVTGAPAEIAHHVISCGLKSGCMGGKIGDNYAIPLTQTMHQLLHHDPVLWESRFGQQMEHLYRTAHMAFKAGELPSFDAWVIGLEFE